MKRSEAFPSNFLSKDDVATPVIAIIESISVESIQSEDGEKTKPVVYFQGGVKPLILNNTNWMSIEDMYGDESDNWPGKSIELFCDPSIMFGNKRVGGVRIRAAVSKSFANFAEANKYAIDAGLVEGQLAAFLKEKGLKGFNGERDSATVRAYVEDATAEPLL